MPTIQLSEQTFRRIKERAIPFEDSKPEDVVCRLLDKTEAEQSEESLSGDTPADLVTKGGRIPHGSKLRMTYKGTEFRAVVDDGKITWNGERFDSPSQAAVAAIRSTGSDRTTANGWREWYVKTPESGEWRLAKDLQSDLQSDKALIAEAQRKIEKLSDKQKAELRQELLDQEGAQANGNDLAEKVNDPGDEEFEEVVDEWEENQEG